MEEKTPGKKTKGKHRSSMKKSNEEGKFKNEETSSGKYCQKSK